MRYIKSLFIIFLMPVVALAWVQFQSIADHPSIAYTTSTPTDPVARLKQRLESGEIQLEPDGERGYLTSVLQHLNIPVASQTLVFSKTSLQADKIAPWSPRALYFNDDVYVGWVPDGTVVEIASMDPRLGAVFYTISQADKEHPQIRREFDTCLLCHDSSSSTGGVPGLIVRSVYPDRYGYTVASAKTPVTTDQSPIEHRWGGWYVTGNLGSQPHMGNMKAPVPAHEVGNVERYISRVDLSATGHISELGDRFDTSLYLSPHSDAVALLILAHQAYVHNLIVSANYEGRTLSSRAKHSADLLARAMLFVKEAPLSGPVSGTTGYAAEFSRQGPHDGKGRSLRDLDLDRRLFKYPLSYLIYSEAFNALPPNVREFVYQKIREVLTGTDTSGDFAHLSADDRKAILEILAETKPDFRNSGSAPVPARNRP